MLNKVLLIGRLTRAPECRYISNSDCVCNFGLATSEKYTDKSGNKVEKTEFHNITMYRKLAEIAAKYLQKGSLVYLEGRIQSRKYTGKDGIERTAFDIIASEMKMLGGKAEGSSESTNTAALPAPPRHQAPAAPAQPVDDTDGIPF
ncbi:single-stranded DNA-binding protein [Eikenella corrodens]|uniref:single-stranded DNA-binding protein n=1 Tax=Eikenella corrodens TaxID=539 RepID=UPI0028EC6DF8|nr:single-stranded DNA-binding protein [Eikenella corrodens]